MKRALSLFLSLILCAALAAPVHAAEFSDVPGSYIFHQAIMDCVGKGILSGYSDGTFRPSDSVTRAQFCVMLTRAFYPGEADAYDKWKSVDWYGPSAALLKEKGILFYGDQYWKDPAVMKVAITRRDMSAFLAGVLKNKGYTVSEADKNAAKAKITDFSSVGEFYEDAVKTVFALGILTGRADGSFDGSSVTNRGQSAVVIYRALQCLNAAPGTIKAPEKPEQAPSAVMLNGKAVTEENVLEAMKELRAQYPENTDFSAGYPTGNDSPVRTETHVYERSRDPSTRTSNTLGCGGWSTLISDTIFGQAGFPLRKVPLADARPSDIGIQLDANNRLVHVFTIAERPKMTNDGKLSFLITEAGTDSQDVYRIHWDRTYSWKEGDKYHFDVFTRYPE